MRRSSGAAPKALAESRQGEALIGIFRQDAKAGERAHQPVQRRSVRAGRSGQVGGALRPARQMIGEVEFRGGVHRRDTQ